MLLIVSCNSTSGITDAIKWSLISTAVSILPVLLAIAYLARNGRLDSIFISVRGQRTKIYWLAGVCTSIGCIVLHYSGAPSILVATFIVGLSAVAIFTCINLLWKISVHTAFITASVTVLVILYGWLAAMTVVLVPLISWARIELKHHSPAQVATAAPLAALIVVVVFYLFGLV